MSSALENIVKRNNLNIDLFRSNALYFRSHRTKSVIFFVGSLGFSLILITIFSVIASLHEAYIQDYALILQYSMVASVIALGLSGINLGLYLYCGEKYKRKLIKETNTYLQISLPFNKDEERVLFNQIDEALQSGSIRFRKWDNLIRITHILTNIFIIISYIFLMLFILSCFLPIRTRIPSFFDVIYNILNII